MIKKHLNLLKLTVLLFLYFSNTTYACTTVFWNNNGKANVVARTTDLFVSDQPLLIITPRGVKRNGDAGDNSLKWQAKYGAVIITAFRSNTVSDGMNEKGLVAHLLYLSGTTYPTPNTNTGKLANLLWAQYMLDNFATVDEALKNTKDLQIVSAKVHGREWPIHLAMEDATGDSAIIEFIDGKMHVYHGKQYTVMTNEPAYNIQLENLKKYQGFGGHLSLPGDPDPLSRFVRSATFLKTLPAPSTDLESIAGVLSVIRTAMVPFGAVDTSGNEVEDAWATRWVSVADATNKVYYFNSTSAPNIIWVDFSKVNFAAGAPTLVIDPVRIDLVGDVTKQLLPVK